MRGEPSSRPRPSSPSTVYPRARGGASPCPKRESHGLGLSPRTRGSRCRGKQLRLDRGSIPAHAGEPECRYPTSLQQGVYPRARGGASPCPKRESHGLGLSPRTRGSQPTASDLRHRRRSIPAHAGEPSLSASQRIRARVYPRARGGAAEAEGGSRPVSGLSPRTRGSPDGFRQRLVDRRSIPAHAGEPCVGVPGTGSDRVYPRARGGACITSRVRLSYSGLSPRTRGSPDGFRQRLVDRRSIPAHAGEPQIVVPGTRVLAVYPRARGGAYRVDAVDRLPPGLSPRTRGSRCRYRA